MTNRFTGSVLSTSKNQDGLELTVSYQLTDGVVTDPPITEPHVPNAQRIVSLVDDAVRFRNRPIDQAEAIAALDVVQLVGPIDDVRAVVFPPPDDEDPEVAALRAWQKSLSDYRIAKNGEALGLLMSPPSDQILSEIQITWNNLTDIQQTTYKTFLGGSPF